MDQLIDQSTDKPGMDGLFKYEDYASAQQPVIFLPVEGLCRAGARRAARGEGVSGRPKPVRPDGAGPALLHGGDLVKLALLLAALLAAPVAWAQEKGDCGTIVLPTGAGQTGSDDLTSFSPLFSDTAYNQEASWLMYPDLLWINRFSRIDWSRSLATAVTTADNTTFTITVRPWHWSDGVKVTAEDVAYAFALIKQLGPTWPGYGGGGLPYIVKSLKVTGPLQLEVTTVHPVNAEWFIYNGISNLSPLPRHVWKNYTVDQQFQLQSTPSFFRRRGRGR